MPNKTKARLPETPIKQALAFLDENNFNGFLEQMALFGEWLQSQHHLPRYKGHEAVLRTVLRNKIKTPFQALTVQQALAFETLQNAWHDAKITSLRQLRFVSTHDPELLGEPNTCLFLRIAAAPYWQIIPIDAEGKKQAPLDFRLLDEVEEIVKKLPEHLINQNPLEYSFADQERVARLKRALKRANLKVLDQSRLKAKADLSKDSRHRLKLGLQAFKILCVEGAAPSIENENPSSHLHLEIMDEEPSAERLRDFNPKTYLVIRPQKGRHGRIFFYKKTRSKKKEIQSVVLQTALDGDQLIYLSNDETFQAKTQSAFDEKIRLLLFEYHCRQLDVQAQKAIREYKTGWQKIKRVVEYALAALTAFTYGTVEMVATMLGFFVAAGIVWTNPWLAVVGVLLLAGTILFPIPSTWTNWKIFSTYLPAFFDKIGDEYREINSPRKKILFWVLAVLALATGIAAGALAYTATLALPAMIGLGAIGIIFPYLGIIFAVAIALSQAFSLIRNFTAILRKENSWKSFKKPFSDVKKFLHDNNASWGRRFMTWGLVGGLGLIAIIGLALSCFTSTRSVGKLFIDQFHTAPQKALILGIIISAGCSFFSRIYLTLSSTFASTINLSKRLFKNNPLTFFSKTFDQYKIQLINEERDSATVVQTVQPENFHSKDEVIILVGSEAAQKTAYFIKNKKWVNSEKGPLPIPVNLGPHEQKALAAASERHGLLIKLAQNNEAGEFSLESTLPVFVKKTVAQAKSEMLATKTKPYPIPFKKKAAIITDSALAAAFYAWSILTLSHLKPSSGSPPDVDLHLGDLGRGSAAILAVLAGLTSLFRNSAISFDHAGRPEDAYEKARQQAADKRVENNTSFYRQHNPHCIFAKPREPLEPHYEWQSSAHHLIHVF